MAGILLDTHALYWLVSCEVALAEAALVAIGECQAANTLFVSPISSWELAVATQKNRAAGCPHLGQAAPARWFREAIFASEARLAPIQQRVADEAARVVTSTGHKGPGDCFLIATARVRKLALVTRDEIIQRIAAADRSYLDVIAC